MVYVRRLRWDAWNVAHIARHHVTPEEVEEVCQGVAMTSETYLGRLRLIGASSSGRMLTIILAPEDEDVYYTITARPASRKERGRYSREMGGQP